MVFCAMAHFGGMAEENKLVFIYLFDFVDLSYLHFHCLWVLQF